MSLLLPSPTFCAYASNIDLRLSTYVFCDIVVPSLRSYRLCDSLYSWNYCETDPCNANIRSLLFLIFRNVRTRFFYTLWRPAAVFASSFDNYRYCSFPTTHRADWTTPSDRHLLFVSRVPRVRESKVQFSASWKYLYIIMSGDPDQIECHGSDDDQDGTVQIVSNNLHT